MPNLQTTIRRLGALRSERARVLPRLAAAVAIAAQKNEIDRDDAMELYLEYYKASAGVTSVDPYDPGIQANASKLRQIIKAADPELLARVTETHKKLSRTQCVKPLYHAMVAACRRQNRSLRKLSADAIAKAVRK